MAFKKDKRKKYEGPKLAGDTAAARDERLKRAQKNASGGTNDVTNDVFSVQDEPFKAACRDAHTDPTKRQASKWRQPAPYGLAARSAGRNVRKDPRRA
jgi:hypothetical protein